MNIEAKAETVAASFERDPELQDYWIKRLIAYVIDSIMVGVVAAVVLSIVMFLLFIANPSVFFNAFNFPFAMGLLYIFYYPIAESTNGATFGKRLMGLKVVTKTGEKPTLEKAFIRNISKIHPVLLILDLIGGLITSPDLHQKYSDRITNTTVA